MADKKDDKGDKVEVDAAGEPVPTGDSPANPFGMTEGEKQLEDKLAAKREKRAEGWAEETKQARDRVIALDEEGRELAEEVGEDDGVNDKK